MAVVVQALVEEKGNLIHNPHNCRQAHQAGGRTQSTDNLYEI
jgi:hypothetical protein